MLKKIISFVLALTMVLTMVPAQAFAAEMEAVTEETVAVETSAPVEETETTAETSVPTEETAAVEETVSTIAVTEPTEEATPEETAAEESFPEETVPEETAAEEPEEPTPVVVELETGDDEEALNNYLMTLFYPERIVNTNACYMREQLDEVQKYVYDQATKVAVDIVERRRNTVDLKIRFNAIDADVSSFTIEHLRKTMYAFSQDHPYETFWYSSFAYAYVDDINELWLWLVPRAQYYPPDFDYYENPTVQIDVLEQAITALENVNDVLDAYAHYPDYYKLTAYADKICELVEYDYDAIGNWDVDINPSTLINIFDGDPTTGVVCQGYAEGYQYLCDRSEFRGDVKCYYAGNGQPSINHAWNIVRVEGKSYLLDVTHTDVGSYARRSEKFMGYGSNSVSEGYVLDNFHYWYDDEMLGIWGSGPDSILQLADTPLDPEDFLVPMTQTDFDAALRGCSGSYYLENSVMLSSSLSLDGIHLTIGPGGKLIVAADTLLKISANSSLRLDYGAVLEIKNGGTVACFGDYSAHDMSTLVNSGKFYADVSGLLAWYADHCGSMTAQEIRDVLQAMGAENILAAMEEDPSCGQNIAVLEEKAGLTVAVAVSDTVVGFPEDPLTAAGAGFNTPDGSGDPMCLELGILKGQSGSVEAGFSLTLKNAKHETDLDFPVQITLKLPDGMTAPGLFLEHRRADGTWETVTYTSPEDTSIQFATMVLGDFRVYYLTSGSCGTAAAWSFDRETGELTISGTGSTQDYRSLEARPWYGLGYAGKIKEITVEEGITRIGQTSFYQINSVEKLTLPDSLTEIGETAFLQCHGIRELNLPENLKVIGTHAFFNCNGLSALVFPAGFTTIGDGAFRYCFGLKHIVFRGDAPEFVKNASSVAINFQQVVADVYYPAGNSTWAEAAGQNYGGTLTWKSGCDGAHTVVTVPGKAATCTTTGLTTGEYCSVCGAVLAVQKTIPAKGHYTVTTPAVSPTCTEPGMTGGSYCGNCGEVFTARREIGKLGHNQMTDPASDPTCTQPGRTEGAHCSRCSLIMIAQTEIPALGHIEVTDQKTDPTCTEEGRTEGVHCSRCQEVLIAQTTVPALGHDRITDAGREATCTEDGLTEGSHCGRCREVLIAQTTVPALGHDLSERSIRKEPTCTENGEVRYDCSRCDYYETAFETAVEALGHAQVIDGAVAPTCTEDGLTEGTHCGRCGEVLIPQEVIPATGHSFESRAGNILCTACGEELIFRLSQEYAVLTVGEPLTLEVYPEEFAGQTEWSVEEEEGIVAMAGNVLTAAKPGTAYVTATLMVGEATLTARCRVDVTEATELDGVQLNATKATVELFSTDYADLEILLKLPQNYTMSEQAEVQDNGIAIDSAWFTEDALAKLFEISILDDRRIQIVPTEYAVENPGKVKSKYTGTITVTVWGKEYKTDSLTLTVKQTKPKMKASVSTFNSFYTSQSKAIKLTGAAVTGISLNPAKTQPNWLDLEDGMLTLNEKAPKKSTSGKTYLLVDTEEWRIPAEVTLSVKNSYKAPGVKLKSSTVTATTLKDTNGVSLKLVCSDKKNTLSGLNVTGITAPGGYAVENFDPETGAFTLKAENGFRKGTLTLKVNFANTTRTVSLKVTVKTAAVTLKASAKAVALNTDALDTAVIKVTATPANYRIEDLQYRLTNSKGKAIPEGTAGLPWIEVDGDEISVGAVEGTAAGKSYRLYLKAGNSKEIYVTVTTVNSSPSVTLTAKGAVDLSFPESEAIVTAGFKNYASGEITAFDYDVIEKKGKTVLDENAASFFTVEQEGRSFRVGVKDADSIHTGSTYTLKLRLTLTDGKVYTKSVGLTVKRTAVKLKLSATKLTLNNLIGDQDTIKVTSATKGYDLQEPVWELKDKSGKKSAEGKLDVSFSSGRLTVATNEETGFGTSYKLILKADEFGTASTVTVAVPAKSKSKVTVSLKAGGKIDVIRDGSAVTVTPSYKNRAGAVPAEERLIVYSVSGKKETVIADSAWAENELLSINRNNAGKFVITKLPGAQLSHSLTYKVQLISRFGETTVTSEKVKIKVTMGSAKLTVNAETPNLFVWDRYSRMEFRIAAADSTLNAVSNVRIKEAKYRKLFDIHSYGNDAFALGFAGNEADSSLMGEKAPRNITVTLQIFLEGNAGTKANAEVKLKVNLVNSPLTTSVSVVHGDTDVTGQVLELYAEEELALTGVSKPDNAVGVFAWSSSDPSVVTVDSGKGILRAKKLGTATITCTAIDGSGKSASVTGKVNPPETGFTLNLTGDWDSITAERYQETLTEVFHTVYPRVYARIAAENKTKTVTVKADSTYEGVAYTSGDTIVISANYANANPSDMGFLAHELTHVAQNYGNRLNYGGDAWWTENLANYARFRYYAWARAETVKVYSKDDASLRDWGYKSYGSCEWFFAYLDDRYPTLEDSSGARTPGLIDSLNDLVQQNQGEKLDDDPKDTTSRFNRIVQEITGFDCIESLRVRFAEELQEGTWTFTGFGAYRDNFLTENLPGVKDPEYPAMTEPVHGQKTAAPVSAVTTGDNLCAGATVLAVSGQVNENEGALLLIDGNFRTKWCCNASTATDHRYNLDGTKQWIVLDLGGEKEFNTYTILNTKTVEPSYGNMTQWEMLASHDGESWTSVDYQPDCDQNSASFRVGQQSARYVMLRIYNPDDSQRGTIRLYEFMLYRQ